MAQLVEPLGQKTGGLYFDFQWGPQSLTEMSTKEFPWGKVRSEHRSDNPAVLVMPNVKVRMETKIPHAF